MNRHGVAVLAASLALLVAGSSPAQTGTDTWQTVRSTSLEVRYSDVRDAELARAVLDKAVTFIDEVGAFLGVGAGEGYSIVLAESPERFLDLQPTMRSAPEWAGALSYPGLRLVLIQTPSALKISGDLYWSLLHHEMVHAVMGDAEIRAGIRLPRWFAEGVASYVAGEMTLPRFLSLSIAQLTGRVVPFQDLETDFPADPESAEVAYARSYLFVKYVTRRFGDDGVAKLFLSAIESGGLDRGIARAFGISRAELMEGFDQYARVKTTWIPIITSTGAVWGAITLLFILTYFQKRLFALRTLRSWDEEEQAAEETGPVPAPEEKDASRTLH